MTGGRFRRTVLSSSTRRSALTTSNRSVRNSNSEWKMAHLLKHFSNAPNRIMSEIQTFQMFHHQKNYCKKYLPPLIGEVKQNLIDFIIKYILVFASFIYNHRSLISNHRVNDPNIIDYSTAFCKMFSIEMNWMKSFSEFDKDHPESAENLAFPAHVAALNGDLDHLKMLIEQGIVGLNERDDKGATPAHKVSK